MNLNDPGFLVFTLIALVACFQVRPAHRWIVMLVASYGFYAAFLAPQLLITLMLVTAVSYFCALRVGLSVRAERRLLWMRLGIGACVLLLAAAKYFPVFLPPSVRTSIPQEFLISVGVSFFVFQAIAYIADVYIEEVEAEPHFGYFATSLAFFPKLLQGPIERAGTLLPQLRSERRFDYDAVRSGALLFAAGLCKKNIIADRLALYVNPVYSDPRAHVGFPLIFATYAYALQIYFDFAGYTDMARGCARALGIELSINFNRPYSATSIADFWRRWHISFSRWLLDYIFKPLQVTWRGLGRLGTAIALVFTFLLSGICHGASWCFLVWGLLHGVFLAASTYWKPYGKRLNARLGIEGQGWTTAWKTFVTFNMVCLAWIFFRAASLGDALLIVRNLFQFEANARTIVQSGLFPFIKENLLSGNSLHSTCILLASFGLIVFARGRTEQTVFALPKTLRWSFYYLVVAALLFLSVSSRQFLYLQF